MATFQVTPPEKFSFKPEEWCKWTRRFERFRVASELNKRDEESQVNTLTYSMGDEADDILQSFGLSDADRKKYTSVKDKFEGHFIIKRNVIFERARFNMRVQEEDESVDSFITDLYTLAEFCVFGDLHDELIRDRIVVGIRDKNLSERLQLESELTLSKAINAVRQKEVVKKQQNLMSFKAFSAQQTVDAVKSSKQRNPSRGKGADVDSRYNKSEKNQNKQSATKCERCSGPPHQKQACPARNSKSATSTLVNVSFMEDLINKLKIEIQDSFDLKLNKATKPLECKIAALEAKAEVHEAHMKNLEERLGRYESDMSEKFKEYDNMFIAQGISFHFISFNFIFIYFNRVNTFSNYGYLLFYNVPCFKTLTYLIT